MTAPPTPWWGLAAVAAMFLLPWLPARFFDGPKVVKHPPRRHVCGGCWEDWTPDHQCEPVVPLHAEVHRPSRELERPR